MKNTLIIICLCSYLTTQSQSLTMNDVTCKPSSSNTSISKYTNHYLYLNLNGDNVQVRFSSYSLTFCDPVKRIECENEILTYRKENFKLEIRKTGTKIKTVTLWLPDVTIIGQKNI